MTIRTTDPAEKPGGVFGPQEPASRLTELPLRELHNSGLLWLINRNILWDLGLALAVERDNADPDRFVRLFVLDTIPPERIVNATADDLQFESLQRWLSTRVGRVRG